MSTNSRTQLLVRSKVGIFPLHVVLVQPWQEDRLPQGGPILDQTDGREVPLYGVLLCSVPDPGPSIMKIGLRRPCQEVTNPRLSKCGLVHKGFPAGIDDMEWDLTMVDTTTGCHENAPGRMTAIYTVGPNWDNVILPFVRNMYQSNYYVKSSTQFKINLYYYFSQKLIKRCH
ncbi:hypothetical protein MLD38_001182 [Melastoma candidum]|uniref:Uncharacterized protein n=1 Tax=Melastoma candidum TaxID=119954 RepID=A0ACB9SHB8_9MYRT|nr:hypothetical protein MLD38_001182 [Melastoma candidum]